MRATLDQKMEQNVIIHRMKESDTCDTKLMDEIFAATATQHEPVNIFGLDPENDGKTRSLLLYMKRL